MSNSRQTPLTGQVGVITGAGSGIGAAIARRLAELGAVAVVCGRSRTTLEATAQSIQKAGGNAEVAPCDVTDLAAVEAIASGRPDKDAIWNINVDDEYHEAK